MKLLVVCLAAAMLVGCVQFHASQAFYDPEMKVTVTNDVTGLFVFAKSAVESIKIARKTKTTSALVEGKNAETDGGVEFVKALSAAMGDAFAAGAKGALKP